MKEKIPIKFKPLINEKIVENRTMFSELLNYLENDFDFILKQIIEYNLDIEEEWGKPLNSIYNCDHTFLIDLPESYQKLKKLLSAEFQLEDKELNYLIFEWLEIDLINLKRMSS